MTVFGKHPGRTTKILQAFSSRFAVAFLARSASVGIHPVLAGALVGLLVSLPDALGLNAYVGILGTGLLFGALPGWVTRNLGY
jgi:hypothetical protein